jgi:hypothetical protein
MRTADEYSARFRTSLDVFEAMRPRTLQKELGVSSVGLCHAMAVYIQQGVTPTDAPEGRQAFVGSAIHERVADAMRNYDSSVLIEPELTFTMPSGIVLKGHPDEVDAAEPSVTDVKTVATPDEIRAVRRNGASEQQRFQRHLYYYGAIQAGLVPEEGVVRNVWLDRSGQLAAPYVEQEAFSMEVVQRADMWLESVLYTIEHDEEVMREKHHDWCARFCEFFSHCRQGTDQPDLLITDPELVQAARNALDGRRMKKEGESLEGAGKRALTVLQPDPGGDVAAFQAGDVRLRWTWVNKVSGGYFTLNIDDVDA